MSHNNAPYLMCFAAKLRGVTNDEEHDKIQNAHNKVIPTLTNYIYILLDLLYGKKHKMPVRQT